MSRFLESLLKVLGNVRLVHALNLPANLFGGQSIRRPVEGSVDRDKLGEASELQRLPPRIGDRVGVDVHGKVAHPSRRVALDVLVELWGRLLAVPAPGKVQEKDRLGVNLVQGVDAGSVRGNHLQLAIR